MACHSSKLLRVLLGGLQVNVCPRNSAAIQRFPTKHIRMFMSSARCLDGKPGPGPAEDNLTVNFINRNGQTLTATAKEGESLLEVVVRHHLSIDGFGACEGTLACSTCHLIFDKKQFDVLGPISDEEMDMLDLAFGLTETSRLGCQICMRKALDGLTVRVPKDVSDARGETMGQQGQQ